MSEGDIPGNRQPRFSDRALLLLTAAGLGGCLAVNAENFYQLLDGEPRPRPPVLIIDIESYLELSQRPRADARDHEPFPPGHEPGSPIPHRQTEQAGATAMFSNDGFSDSTPVLPSCTVFKAGRGDETMAVTAYHCLVDSPNNDIHVYKLGPSTPEIDEAVSLGFPAEPYSEVGDIDSATVRRPQFDIAVAPVTDRAGRWDAMPALTIMAGDPEVGDLVTIRGYPADHSPDQHAVSGTYLGEVTGDVVFQTSQTATEWQWQGQYGVIAAGPDPGALTACIQGISGAPATEQVSREVVGVTSLRIFMPEAKRRFENLSGIDIPTGQDLCLVADIEPSDLLPIRSSSLRPH